MARTATFDNFFAPEASEVRREPAPPREHWYFQWEEWLTLFLVVLVQVPVIGSLQSANWADEMPSLMGAAALGIVLGWLLAQSRFHGLLASGFGLIASLGVIVGMVIHTMEIHDTDLGTGLRAHLTEFGLRLWEWGAALVAGGISADPLPFIVLMVAIVVGVSFLAAWSVARWRNPWAALVPGGIVLLTNISYLPGQPSFAFVLYLVAAVLLVTRLHFIQSLRRWRSARWAEPEGMSLEVLGASAVLAIVLVAFAWLVPTANNWGPVADAWGRVTAPVQQRLDGLGNLFIGIGSKRPIPVHAMGPALPLQGRISLDREVLYEVYADEPGFLRGAVYDEYTGAGWRLSADRSVALPAGGVDAARFGSPESRALIRQPVVVEVEVVGDGGPEHRLLAVGDPVAADADAELLVGPVDEPVGLVPGQRLTVGDHYLAAGAVSAAAVETLQEAGTNYPSALFVTYTQLPNGLPAEVFELAQSVVGDASNPYDAAKRIEAFLRDQYAFTLEAPTPPPRRDAVAYFLLEEQRGYFDHFASAMAVMLRTVGVPSRVSVGFVLDERDQDPETRAYHVSELRAWAWPEVYFPGLGWVEFNPTPGRPPVQRPGDDSAARAERDRAAQNEFLFDDPFLEELLQDPFGDGGGFDGSFVGFDDDAGAPGATTTASDVAGRILTFLLVGSFVGLIAVLGLRFAWERSFGNVPPAVRRWGKVQRLAHWAGFGPPENLTSMEAADLVALRIGERDALRMLAASYTRARYGRHDGVTAESDEEAFSLDQHYGNVGRQLWREVFARVLRLGRVAQPPERGRHTYAGARQ